MSNEPQNVATVPDNNQLGRVPRTKLQVGVAVLVGLATLRAVSHQIAVENDTLGAVQYLTLGLLIAAALVVPAVNKLVPRVAQACLMIFAIVGIGFSYLAAVASYSAMSEIVETSAVLKAYKTVSSAREAGDIPAYEDAMARLLSMDNMLAAELASVEFIVSGDGQAAARVLVDAFKRPDGVYGTCMVANSLAAPHPYSGEDATDWKDDFEAVAATVRPAAKSIASSWSCTDGLALTGLMELVAVAPASAWGNALLPGVFEPMPMDYEKHFFSMP